MRGATVTGPLLERGDELARIESALGKARSGTGTFVVVEGPAGIGKTSLLAAARTEATERGMRVLRSRATELEHGFPFGIVRQLFEAVLAEASESEKEELLDGAAGVASGLLGLAGPATVHARREDADPSFAILHGLYWLCANLSAAEPLCVVVDDAQWADAPSLRYLAFLVTRLEELSVTLLAATRPCELGVDAELLATLMTAPSAEVVRLRPLSRDAVAQLLESALDEAPDPVFVDACLRATRGTPFLLDELVGALREGGIPPTAQAAREVEQIGTRSIGRSIQLRLGRLPDAAIRLARALAVLEQGDLFHAARLAHLEVSEATNAAGRLVQAGFLESSLPLEFVHPIVRRSVYEGLSGPDRAQAHMSAARVLDEQPGAGARVAQHLLATEPAGNLWAVERLLGAASEAGRQGAPETEAVFLRRALAEPAPPDDRPSLLLELGMAEASAGLDGWTEHLAKAVDAAPSALAAADAAMVLADALSRAQRFVEAVDVLDRVVESLGPDDGELALRLQAAAVVPAMNDPATAPSVALRRSVLRDRVNDPEGASPELLAAAAFTSVAANEPAEVGAELAARALLAGGPEATDSVDRPWFSFTTRFSRMTLALLWLERYEQLRPLLDESVAEARTTGDGGRLAAGLAHRAWLALRRGDLLAAEVDSRTALAATDLPAPPIYRVFQTGLLVEALTDQGELAAAEEELAAVDSEAERPALNATLLRFARGRLRREQGRIDEGLDDFLGVGAVLVQAHVVSPSFLSWRSEAALAGLALGDRDSAQRLAAEELELARAFGTSRALGVAQRAAGLVAGAERGELLLREAVDALEKGGARLERARALADLGALLRRLNRRADARQLLREALDIAHRAGAAQLADRAETELRATGARPRRVVLTGLDSLTASERRIAELASQSLTNREIAQQLFITDRTVEGHLTSVFRKLRLDSRTELPAALAEEIEVSA